MTVTRTRIQTLPVLSASIWNEVCFERPVVNKTEPWASYPWADGSLTAESIVAVSCAIVASRFGSFDMAGVVGRTIVAELNPRVSRTLYEAIGCHEMSIFFNTSGIFHDWSGLTS